MKTNIGPLLLLSLFTIGIVFSAPCKNLDRNKHTVHILAAEPYIPLIDLLEVGESYQIEITSIGCFNGSKQSLTIFRDEIGFNVRFKDTIKALGAYEINALRDFELKLQLLSRGGCSTVDIYKLAFGAHSIQVSDGTCAFNGGRKLMKQLGFEPGK